MEIEPLELRDHRYHAQKALKALGDEDAEQRQALEAEIAHYQEICPHEHAEEFEGEWRCRDCDLRRTTVAPEPEPPPEAAPGGDEDAPAAEAPAAPDGGEEAPAAEEPAAEGGE